MVYLNFLFSYDKSKVIAEMALDAVLPATMKLND
jgi:hypothetical protein